MEIKTEERAGASIVSITGDLDYNSCKEFTDEITRLIQEKRTPIVIDTEKVTHIDSMGLGALTKLWKTAGQAGLNLVLCAMPKNVQKTVRLVNLDNRIKTYDTVDQALA